MTQLITSYVTDDKEIQEQFSILGLTGQAGGAVAGGVMGFGSAILELSKKTPFDHQEWYSVQLLLTWGSFLVGSMYTQIAADHYFPDEKPYLSNNLHHLVGAACAYFAYMGLPRVKNGVCKGVSSGASWGYAVGEWIQNLPKYLFVLENLSSGYLLKNCSILTI